MQVYLLATENTRGQSSWRARSSRARGPATCPPSVSSLRPGSRLTQVRVRLGFLCFFFVMFFRLQVSGGEGTGNDSSSGSGLTWRCLMTTTPRIPGPTLDTDSYRSEMVTRRPWSAGETLKILCAVCRVLLLAVGKKCISIPLCLMNYCLISQPLSIYVFPRPIINLSLSILRRKYYIQQPIPNFNSKK